MKSNEEWSSQLWTQFMQSRSQLRGSFFIRIKHITYSMYILPHYEVISDIHTRVIHWIMGLTELIPTHFTPDGWHGFEVVGPRMLRVWVERGWVGYSLISLSVRQLGSIITGCYTLKVHSLSGVRIKINQILSLLDKGNAPRSCTAATKLQKKPTNLFIFIIFKLKAQGADMKTFLKWTVYVDDD